MKIQRCLSSKNATIKKTCIMLKTALFMKNWAIAYICMTLSDLYNIWTTMIQYNSPLYNKFRNA